MWAGPGAFKVLRSFEQIGSRVQRGTRFATGAGTQRRHGDMHVTQAMDLYRARSWKLIGLLAFDLANQGCLANEETPSDNAQQDNVVASAKEALSTNWLCGDNDPDIEFEEDVAYHNDSYTSSDGNYNHPQCPHVFIGEFDFGSPGRDSHVSAKYQGPDLTASGFPCNAAWVSAQVYALQNDAWVTIDSASTTYGTEYVAQVSSLSNKCIPPQITIKLNGVAGSYKIAAAAGVATSYQAVSVEGGNQLPRPL